MEQKNPNIETAETEVSLSEILQIRRDKLKALQDKGQDPFAKTKFNVTSYAKTEVDSFDDEAEEVKTVSLAGRIMSKRDMGKAGFVDIVDTSGRVQSYVRKDHLGEDSFADFKKYDVGDIVGITGEVFRTQKGQISVKADEVTLLTKCLKPLPEKWHGLSISDGNGCQRLLNRAISPAAVLSTWSAG